LNTKKKLKEILNKDRGGVERKKRWKKKVTARNNWRNKEFVNSVDLACDFAKNKK